MMTDIAFWDTSAIVPLCCFQPASQKLRTLRRKYKTVAWWGTIIEGKSALNRLFRENVISKKAFAESVKRLETQQKTWYEILATDKVRTVAENLIETRDLRTLDAMQLASALVWCFEKPKGKHFICLDHKLSKSALDLGFTVFPR
ncbi:MAG: type II toxin-antitoxin system VapC family toxin [Pyrinomonadaceae bacterium]|nr:type II toxin-antitoxin system VapC family toxin [Pyrinomonadaceae bacterium]